jgi:hypothetical protein
MKYDFKKSKMEYHFEAQTTIWTFQGIEETGQDGDLILRAIVTLQSLRWT